MSVLLAATWAPHGELPRFERLADVLHGLYEAGIVIVMPPDVPPGTLDRLESLNVAALCDPRWLAGRHLALHEAVDRGAGHIHYCDFDRLLHWAECCPAELAETVERLPQSDCLVMGRTERAWATHPNAMRETEALFNAVFSHLMGQAIDFGASAKGFSRAAAEHILATSPLEAGYVIDVAWPVLLYQAGYTIDYIAVEGLEWETPDRYRREAAPPEVVRQAATEADADPAFWRARVDLAQRIMQAGLDVWRRE